MYYIYIIYIICYMYMFIILINMYYTFNNKKFVFAHILSTWFDQKSLDNVSRLALPA